MEMTHRRTPLPRHIYEIAQEIHRDWEKVYFGAAPYLDAMSSIDNIEEYYGQDSAYSMVAYFLANAQTWRGETARQVKKELKRMLG